MHKRWREDKIGMVMSRKKGGGESGKKYLSSFQCKKLNPKGTEFSFF
jgi:hypothetical protein